MTVKLSLTSIFSLYEALREIEKFPVEKRHAILMREAGVVFYDDELRYIKKGGCCRLVGIGGIPFRLENKELYFHNGYLRNTSLLEDDLLSMAGASAAITYMNPNNKALDDLAKVVTEEHNHLSILHTIYFNIGIFGISSAVEHEFDTQRDLVHLSRMTVARTKAQSYPSFIVLNERHLPALQKVVETVDEVRKIIPQGDDLESVNNLYPALKAHSLILSGTAKNILTLCGQSEDSGKEREYRQVLKSLRAAIWE